MNEKRIGLAGGGISPAAKVTKETVLLFREQYASGMGIAQIRAAYLLATGDHLSHGCVASIVKRRSWKHI